MSLIADAFQPFIRGEFLTINGRPRPLNFADIIIEPKASYYIDFNTADNTISFDFRDSGIVFRAFAGDCCRFASAAFQTISSVPAEILKRDSVAWGMIKLYYSAFYSGQATIRLFGESCSFFDQQHTKKITTTGQAFGKEPPFSIEGGLYKCRLKPGTAELICTKASRGAIGNSHELFWEYFGERIKILAEEILRGSLPRSDAQTLFLQLENLRSLLKKSNKYNWLSFVRNELQYRHKFGAWFPSKPSKAQRQALTGIVKNWTNDPMKISLGDTRVETLSEFTACCVFIVALSRIFLERIRERSENKSRSFVSIIPLAFVNDRQGGN